MGLKKKGGGEVRLVFEDDVVASETPAVVRGVEVVAVGEEAPDERVIDAGGRSVAQIEGV